MRTRPTPLVASLALRGGVVALTLGGNLLGCAPPGGRGRPVAEVGSFDVAAYCDLAGRADVAELTGSSAVVCDAVADGSDEAMPHCRVLVADRSGSVSETELEGAVVALRAGDGRFVVLTEDERLVLSDGRREVRELAAWAAEPSLDAAGARVAFVAALEGAERAEVGDATRLVSMELSSARLTLLSTDETASAPVFTPDGAAVLYVSTATGVASIYRVASAGGAAVQLTNVGANDVGQGFVPAYERQRAWSGETLVFAALSRDDRSELWALDARTGDAQRVGEGAHPLATDDGRIVVIDPMASACPVSVELEVTP